MEIEKNNRYMKLFIIYIFSNTLLIMNYYDSMYYVIYGINGVTR